MTFSPAVFSVRIGSGDACSITRQPNFFKRKIIMRIKKLLDSIGRDVDTVSPDETVYDALALMAEKEIGALVVVE